MLLVVDIGNSATGLAIVDPTTGTIAFQTAVATHSMTSIAQWQALLHSLAQTNGNAGSTITGAMMCSVVPAATEPLTTAILSIFHIPTTRVTADRDLGITLRMQEPLKVGADRLATAVGAFMRYGGPIIIVDAGTATKIDIVTTDGVFPGGVIAPGLQIGLDALISRAAQLGTVPLVPPPQVIGRNTTEAIQSGVMLGHIAMIEGLIGRVRLLLGENVSVVLTGGYGALLHPLSDIWNTFDPNLIFEGLRHLWLRWHHLPESSL